MNLPTICYEEIETEIARLHQERKKEKKYKPEVLEFIHNMKTKGYYWKHIIEVLNNNNQNIGLGVKREYYKWLREIK